MSVQTHPIPDVLSAKLCPLTTGKKKVLTSDDPERCRIRANRRLRKAITTRTLRRAIGGNHNMSEYKEFQMMRNNGRISVVRVNRETGRLLETLGSSIEGFEPPDLTAFAYALDRANSYTTRICKEQWANSAIRALHNDSRIAP